MAGRIGAWPAEPPVSRAPARFVLYAQGRTGSHLLMHLLGAHPQLRCDGEVLNRQQWPGAWQWARRAAIRAPDVYLPWRARSAAPLVWGCKVPIATSVRGLARLQRQGWHILFLQRRSRFDRALSWCVASLTGEFQRSDALRPDTISVPIDMFLAQLAFRRQWDDRSTQAMRAVPHVPLMYEDHLVDPTQRAATCARLFTALHLPVIPVETGIRRSFDRPYRELVANYADVLDAFERSEAAHTPDAP